VNLLCPACHTPLPEAATAIVTCPVCAAEIDLSRAGTAVGRPRYVPEPDRSGRVVAGYHIEGRLGGGGMGTVYRATAPDGRAVAVKFLSPALAGSPELVARFGREVEVLAGLDHPAVVRVLAQGEEGGVPWFAMELVEGEDLRARLRRGRLDRAEVLAIFQRLLAALGHAHDRGIVHRDLKPANVLLAGEGAKLADFGVARWEDQLGGPDAATRLTETAAVIGTLPYMSPEQRKGAAVDRRSDLFSVGVLLYEAITGSVPQGAFSAPSTQNGDFPRALDRLVMALLAPEPERRPASAAEVTRALGEALAPPRRSGRRVIVAGTGAGALALGALFTLWGGRPANIGAVAVKQANGPLPAPQVILPDPPPVVKQPQQAPPQALDEVPVDLKDKLLMWNQGKAVKLPGNSSKRPPPVTTAKKKAASKSLSAKAAPAPVPARAPGKPGSKSRPFDDSNSNYSDFKQQLEKK
jgi:serine/threonine protein kinase